MSVMPEKGVSFSDPQNRFGIRLAVPPDVPNLSQLRAALWPESSAEEHAQELHAILTGNLRTVLPVVVFVAEKVSGPILGFLEVGLRSSADGCDPSRPVGYVEGWYLIDSARRQGIGRALLCAAENWARAQGCREMASDAEITNSLSQLVHEASGFSVTARSVLYRKSL